MSPLGEAIYHVLAPRVGLEHPLISYQELAKKLPTLAPPFDNISRNDERLFKALGEVGIACKERGLPALTALVIRSMEQSPGSGYYHMIHPEAGDDPTQRQAAWEREVGMVGTTTYPPSLDRDSASGPNATPDDRRRSRPLGLLRIADDGSRPSVVFTGHLTCPRCSASVAVEVERNPGAVSPKQPAFVLVDAGASPGGGPVGHLFIGTILSSPVLYYGLMNHCGTEQRLAVFYNRAIRDRSDHHLTVMPSTSAQPSVPPEDESFRLS